MSGRTAARVAWGLWGLGMALSLGGLVFLALNVSTARPGRFGFPGFPAIFAFAFATVGALIASRQPRNPIGWLFCSAGVGSGLQTLAEEYAVYALLTQPGSVPDGLAVAWFQNWVWLPIVGPIVTFLFLLFPNGQLLSPRWRAVVWFAALALTVATIGYGFRPGPVDNLTMVQNPVAFEAARLFLAAGFPLFTGGIVLSASSMVLRLLRAKGDEREQLKWFAYAAILAGVTLGSSLFFLDRIPHYDIVVIGCFLGIPVATAIAILKYRLYEIDLLINRTLVYGPLTAILAGAYIASIQLFRVLFVTLTGQSSDAAIVLTTLVVAAAFTPVKNRLQAFVDTYFKELRDPAKKLQQLSARVSSVVQVLQREQLARCLLDEAADAFDATSGAVYLRQDEEPRCVHTRGPWGGEAHLAVSLRYQDAELGVLLLGPRQNGAAYTDRDRESLQAAADVVAQALTLTGPAQTPTAPAAP